MTEEAPKKYNLFDYTEEQLLQENVLTHYEVLSLSPYCGADQVKKAYRKASLKYHPDKTGRGDDDYVFLAVKQAYDVLYDDDKRQGYDSTAVPFDDSVPPPRATMMEDAMLLYKDEDFYQTFDPVFMRNLRFDAKLRPEAGKKKKGTNGGGSSSNGSGKKKNATANGTKKHKPPSLGNEETPLEQVHAFYEYWIHFDSWRDFSAAAADELQVENELENAESRFEKRWIQREIDKRAKQLKTKENGRIQSLVERAMEADPRLRRDRQAQMEAKEQAKRDRVLAKQREKEEAKAAAKRAEEEAVVEQERAAIAKVAREQNKKQLRKARQAVRKAAAAAYEESPIIWADSYDMGLDLEYLCQTLDLEPLRELGRDFEAIGDAVAALHMIRDRAVMERESECAEKNQEMNGSAGKTNGSNGTTVNTRLPWTKEELSTLAKGVKKYPPGGANRWDAIAQYLNNVCQQSEPRSKDECIAKYNEVAKSGARSNSTAAMAAKEKATATVTAESPAPAPTTTDSSENVEPTKPDGSPDDWTVEQDQHLQTALSKFPASLDKNERWSAIANAVGGKSKKECVQRFKAIREALKKS
jgi:DnaJ family protein C protein 2